MKFKLKNQQLTCISAHAEGHFLVFAGYSRKWQGAVASLVSFEDMRGESKKGVKMDEFKPAKGSIFKITARELEILDSFLGCYSLNPTNDQYNIYYRKFITINLDESNQNIKALVHIKSDRSWKKKPSKLYLE